MKSNVFQYNCISDVNIWLKKKPKFSNKHNYSNLGNKEIHYKYLFYMIFMFELLNISNMNIHKELFNIFKSYEITIKIKGIGNQNILSNYYDNCPNKVYLNEVLINISDCHIINIFSQESNENEINTIKLIWNYPLTSLEFMFSGCSSLISLNLSDFDTSSVNDMKDMFYGCSSLISLDLSNFDTSNVKNMNNMFYGCSSLLSLNLSNFNTSSVTVMRSMFAGCSSLTSLNLLILILQV